METLVYKGCSELEIVIFQLAGLADQELQKNAGSGPCEHYNVKTTLAFGEGEARIEFKEYGILLADGSQCFFKGLKVDLQFISTLTLCRYDGSH